MSAVITKKDSIRSQIVRALLCAAGKHEPWERENAWNSGTEPVFMSIQSDMHGEVHCAVCKHCRTLYVRRRRE